MRLKLNSEKEKERRQERKKIRLGRARSPRAKRWLTFFIALFISAILWLVTALNDPSNSYVELVIPLKYQNRSNEYAFEKEPPKELRVQLEANGIQLLRYSLNPRGDTISHFVTQEDIKNRRFEVSEALMMQRVRKSIGNNLTIRWIAPSSISIPFYRRSAKTVPIDLRLLADVRSGYLLHRITIEPSSVEIYGTQSVLDTVKRVLTDEIRLNDLYENLNLWIPLQAPEGVVLARDSVQALIKVEQLTEQKFEVPITAINVPDNVRLRPLPATVLIQIVIPESAYNKYKAQDFSPIVDYNDLLHMQDPSASSLLNVEMETIPDGIDHYKLTPTTVQYILEKN